MSCAVLPRSSIAISAILWIKLYAKGKTIVNIKYWKYSLKEVSSGEENEQVVFSQALGRAAAVVLAASALLMTGVMYHEFHSFTISVAIIPISGTQTYK